LAQGTPRLCGFSENSANPGFKGRAQSHGTNCRSYWNPTSPSGIPGSAASLGISLYPPDGKNAEALAANADAAMYRAKKKRNSGALSSLPQYRPTRPLPVLVALSL